MKAKRGSRRTDKNLRDAMYHLYKGICQGCGIMTDFNDYEAIGGFDGHRHLGPTYPTLEHVVPRTFLGRSVRENVTLFCRECNQRGSERICKYLEGEASHATTNGV